MNLILKRQLSALTIWLLSLGIEHGLCLETQNNNPNEPTQASTQNAPLGTDFRSFRINQLTVLYYHQISLSGSLFWTPRLSLAKDLNLYAQLGTHLIKANTDQLTLFFAPEAQALINYKILGPIQIEVGTGIQYWAVIDGTIRSVFTLQAHYAFEKKPLSCIESLFIGWTGMLDYELFPQYRIGAQFSF